MCCEKTKRAVWGYDYDMRTDKNYKRPMCKECQAPVIQTEQGKYICISCYAEMTLTEEMQKWIKARQGSKKKRVRCVEYNTCEKREKCGGYYEVHCKKNPVTCKYEAVGFNCLKKRAII